MTSERVTSGAKLALLSAALLLLIAACDQGTEPTEEQQGAAPTMEQSTTAATEGEQPEQQQ